MLNVKQRKAVNTNFLSLLVRPGQQGIKPISTDYKADALTPKPCAGKLIASVRESTGKLKFGYSYKGSTDCLPVSLLPNALQCQKDAYR